MKRVFNTRTKRSKDNWETPQYFYDLLDNEFHFTLDPCASHLNHKCVNYFTKEDNGLKQSWKGHKVFCNPPYSDKDKWIKKAFWEGANRDTLVVLLIPTASDTKIWHKYIMKAKEIRFIKGRIKFELDGESQGSPNFASSLIIFEGDHTNPRCSSFLHKEKDLIKKKSSLKDFL